MYYVIVFCVGGPQKGFLQMNYQYKMASWPLCPVASRSASIPSNKHWTGSGNVKRPTTWRWNTDMDRSFHQNWCNSFSFPKLMTMWPQVRLQCHWHFHFFIFLSQEIKSSSAVCLSDVVLFFIYEYVVFIRCARSAIQTSSSSWSLLSNMASHFCLKTSMNILIL